MTSGRTWETGKCSWETEDTGGDVWEDMGDREM